jgi:hypothetical protein
MATFPADTNAAVVILADIGSATIDGSYNTEFTHHRRIKLLKESAYDTWASVSIFYEDGEEVTGIKGTTYVLGADGKVQKHELDRKSVFREEAGRNLKRIRFTLPALVEGAVIEYQYTHRTESPFNMPDWWFQSEEPTRWSEFRAEIPTTLAYTFALLGSRAFDFQGEEPVVRPGYKATKYHWGMVEVPALREEPFMTSTVNYRARLFTQLSAYLDRVTNASVPVYATWEQLGQELMEMPQFGRYLKRPTGDVKRRAAAAIGETSDPEAVMKAVYDDVRATVRWDEVYSFFPDKDPDAVLQTGTGNSAEVNFLLVSMLEAAGLEALPVFVSTRSHGFILESYPMLRQFNHLLAYVRIGSRIFLLDATDPLRPWDLLPYNALNGKGWLVQEGVAAWVNLQAGGAYKHLTTISAVLSADGGLTGTLQATDDGYSALERRQRLAEEKPEDHLRQSLLGDLGEVELTEHRIADLDSIEAPVTLEAAFAVPVYAQVAGDFIYLNPMMALRQEENPLRLPNRTFPVDLAYPRDLSFRLDLRLPEGYLVQEQPPNVRETLVNRGGMLQRSIEVTDGVLRMNYRFSLSKAVYPAQEYQDLRAFFDRLVAVQAQQVVLKKATGDGQ